ncbi:50S ribosomal protein L6 [Candidatus Gottesmanbacteria bacterium]|nr:50S ribosomal protein L6 [Candidatus Gottesmanbacteria bacterium]
MSRIGRSPVVVPKGVTVVIKDGVVSVTGTKGTLFFTLPEGISAKAQDQTILIARNSDDRVVRSHHGFARASIMNNVTGVSTGWTKTLELSGVGYRVAMSGVNIVLTIGFSHTVTVTPPSGIVFQVVDGNIVVSGQDKQNVGQTAASIREIKKPEPYKGKGIKYQGEYIRKKAGKAKAAGATAGGAK